MPLATFCGGAAFEPLPGEVERADHDRQHIVEIVGDAAGELADRFDLLHLAHLALGRAAALRLLVQADIGGGERPLRGQGLGQPAAHADEGEQAERDGEQAGDDERRQQIEAIAVGIGGAQRQQPVLLRLHRAAQPPDLVHHRPPAQEMLGLQRLAAPESRRARPPAAFARRRHGAEPLGGGALARIVLDQPAQPGEIAGEMADRFPIGLEEFGAPGEQIAALAGLGVDQARHHQRDGVFDLERVADQSEGLLLARREGGGGDDRDDEQQEAGDDRGQGIVPPLPLRRRAPC